MPANRNALIRYKTIDTCLRNKYRQWTLEDLIDACSDALYEYEGIDKGISKRTVQMDIQMMRSEKLGYNAPIVVYDNKYYKYEDDNYSITNTPLSEQDLKTMSEAVEVLRQFKGFSYFSEMSDIVSRLEDHVTSAKQKTIPVIDFEKNENLKGLNFLDIVYNAIINKQVLLINYRSFKARDSKVMTFYPYLLKEYRNRWFVFGNNKNTLNNLALDRIISIEVDSKIKFIENKDFDPTTFFDDVVGVTKNIGMKPIQIQFWASGLHAPYIKTKPIHKSQQVIQENKDRTMIFELNVIMNFELERVLLGFGDGIKILSPRSLVNRMQKQYKQALALYADNKQERE